MLICLLSVLILHLSPASAALCPEGWTGEEGLGCFHFLPAEASGNWSAAGLSCLQAGGYLAEPQTDQHMEFLLNRVQALQSFTDIQQWWIGLTDNGKEGAWIWQNSESVADKTFWCAGSPSIVTDNDRDCADR